MGEDDGEEVGGEVGCVGAEEVISGDAVRVVSRADKGYGWRRGWCG